VSRNVYDQVKNKVSVRFEPRGMQRVKNIAEPVAIYRVLLDGAVQSPRLVRWLRAVRSRPAVTIAAVTALLLLMMVGVAWQFRQRGHAPVRMPSVAVLAFDNLSGDRSLDYFSDGVSEDITTMLSRFPDLVVVARNSSFAYKGKAVDVRQIGRDLGVGYVLEGSVRKASDKVRIVAQLIDARTGEHVWAERYDNEGADPWKLQDEVTSKIIGSLAGERGRVKQAEYRQAWGKDSANLEEYDYYLRGHQLWYGDKEDVERAGAIWSEGLRRFPESSLLRVKLGWYHIKRVWGFWSNDPPGDLRRAKELARTALADADASPLVRRYGHWLLADLHQLEGDFDRASSEAEAAIALSPYDGFMISDLSVIIATAGKPQDALKLLEELGRRDPQLEQLSGFLFPLALAYYLDGKYDRSVEYAMKLPTENSDRYILAASNYVRLGRLADARGEMSELLKLNPRFSRAQVADTYVYRDPSIFERQVADLTSAGLPAK
jgi:TolB-like protein